LPVVGITLIGLAWFLPGRANMSLFYLSAVLMASTTIVRAIICRYLEPKLEGTTGQDLDRFEFVMWISLIANTTATGMSFWLVAAYGDLIVKFLITLIAFFYASGSLVNSSSHFPSFAIGILLNLGQGVLFWCGLSPLSPAQYEVAIPFMGVALLFIGFGRENAREFRESIRIRMENVALLEQVAAEKLAVDRALAEAKRANEAKSRFLAAASHDLRQPLHAMTMFLGTLSLYISDAESKRLLQRIKDTARALEDQFNALLDLSKFDVGAVEPDIAPFRVDRLISNLVEEFRPQAEAKGLSVLTDLIGARALSDSVLIERVLRNLLGNAVKYTEFGSITVQAIHDNGRIRIDIIDTGPGIPDHQALHIFEEYVQLSNPARQREKGTGLGLAIVKRIDVLLGLDLHLESAVGEGSKFSFYLPIARHNTEIGWQPPPLSNFDTFRTNARAWVLDDDLDAREALAGQLAAWGAEVVSFSTAQALLAHLEQGADVPDWLFSDDMLGDGPAGLEFAQDLITKFPIGCVCIVTGNTNPKRLAELQASGLQVLIKPAKPEAVAALLAI
jgi:signal transduction histidine kinase/CheY-like chemotaxis protein